MKYRIISSALAGLVLLTGCSSTDQKPDSSSASLIEGLVSGTSSNTGTLASGTPASGTPVNEPQDATEDAPPRTASDTSSSTTVHIPTAEVTTTPDADTDFDIFFSEVGSQFALTEEEMSFVEHSLFVGDSICSGFGGYGIVPWDNVAAKGNLGSRSFFDYTFSFRDKEEQTYAQVLKTAKPRYVFLSMGMNDVNMVYEDTYCENYRKVIQATLDGSSADVFVAAITPVCSDFCANSVIDSFNDYMRRFIAEEFPERVHFIDFGQYLKNERGKLRTCLHSGDGVHLGPYCYYIALWEMHRALMEAGLWDGTAPVEAEKPADPKTEEPEEKPQTTTAKTTKPSTTEKTTKPSATTKTTKPKPDKTTASPKESTEEPEIIEIPVD